MNNFNGNIDPNLWGSSGWKFIHYTALGYPNEPNDIQKKQYYSFFINIGNILPCEKCRNNYIKHFQDFPLEKSLEDKRSLFEWTINIHNEVNKELGKKIYSFEEVEKMYTNNSSDKNYQTIMYISISLLLFFILLFIQNKTNLFSRLF
jgi:hypothetical protein